MRKTVRKQTEDGLRHRVEQLAALHKTMLDITAQRDLPKLLQAIVRRATKLLKGSGGGLYLCDDQKQECRCVVSYKTPRDYTGTVLKYGEGAAGMVAATSQPLIIDDYHTWSGRAEVYEEQQPFNAVLTVPMLWHGQVTGVIHVLRGAEEQPFSQDDLELLTLFASQAAIAVENARALEAERAEITERKRIEKTLRESHQLLEKTFVSLHDAIFIIDADTVEIMGCNPAASEIFGYSREEMLGRTTTLLHVDEASLEEFRKHLSPAVEEKGFLFLPEFRMKRKDGTIFSTEHNVIPLEDERGKRIGWVSVVRDITERKQAERVQEALYQIASAAVSTPGLESLYHSIHQVLGSLMPASNFYIALYDREKDLLSFPYFVDQYEEPTPPHPPGRGLTECVLRTNSPLLASPQVFKELMQAGEVELVGTESLDWLGVPLNVEDETIGVMVVQSYEEGTRYSQREMEIMTFVSSQVAMAIQRKRAEESLAASEERYRQLVEFAPDAIAIHCEGRVVYINPAGIKMVGAQGAEQIIGRPALDFVHPDYHQVVIERMRQGIEQRISLPPLEEKFLRLDGSVIDVEVTAIPRTYQGKPAVQVVIRDITERRQAEASLREAEEKYRTLVEQVPAAVYIDGIDETSSTIYVSPHVTAMTGYSPEEWQAAPELWVKLLHPEDLERVLEENRRTNETGEPFRMEYRLIAKDGRVVWISDQAGIIRDETGQPRFWHGIMYEITERKRAEEALQRQLEELTVLHAVALAGVQATNIDGLIGQVTQTIGETLYPDNFGVLLVDETTNALRPHPSYRGTTADNLTLTLPLSQGITGKAATSGKVLRIGDVRKEPAYFEVTPGIRAELCVPIKIGERAIGVINAESKQADFFNAEDERLLVTVAGQMATAIEKLRLFEAEARRRQEAETLQEATAVVAATLNQEQAIQLILEQLARVVSYDSASVQILGDGYLEIVGGRGWPDPAAVLGLRFPIPDDNPNTIVIQQRRPYILGNAPEKYSPFHQAPHSHILSWLGVPLLIRDRVIGMLAVDSGQPNHFTEESARLVSAFANQAAVALENARLYQEARRAAERRAVLHRLSQDIVRAIQDPEQTYQSIHQATKELMPCDAFVIVLQGEVRKENEAVYMVEGQHRWPPQRIPAGRGLSRKVIAGGKTMVIDDLSPDDKSVIHFGTPEQKVRSVLAVPLRIGETTGMISAQCYQPRAYGEEEQALLEMLAVHAAIAVENARLFAETRRRLNESEVVNRISTTLRAAPTLDKMLPSLLDETLSALNTDVGALWLYKPDRDELVKMEARGWLAQLPIRRLRPGEGIGGHTFKTGEIHISADFSSDPYVYPDSREKIPSGWGGACIPVRILEEVIGALYVAIQSPRQITKDELRLLSTLTEIAGIAIRRAILHEQTERQLQRLAALRSIDLAISSVLDLRVVLDILLGHITAQLGMDAANILLLNPHTQTLEYTTGQGFRTAGASRVHLKVGESQAWRAALERRTITMPDLPENLGDLFKYPDLIVEEGFHAYFATPLIIKGQMKGVLEVFHREAIEPDADWLSFFETMASQAAIAVDNAELFEGLQRSNLELSMAYDATIEGWSRALDLRDRETEGHTQRVTEMTVQLAQLTGVPDADLVHIRRGALLHDIGKMGIPDSILHKPAKLTDEEWKIMRQHPVFAFEMLSPIARLRQAMDIPYCHHERWDGSGYPHGLKGEQIPLSARIFAVVDVWDALTSERPYRKAWTKKTVNEYLQMESGKIFDPKIVDMFLRIVSEK